MAEIILITACNSAYFSLLEGLLGSITKRPTSAEEVNIGLLDCGLTGQECETLQRRGIKVLIPDWDYNIQLFPNKPKPFLKAITARPHLPKYFPGYKIYVWIDSDCWVQDWSAIELYIDSARRSGFAVTPACDRSYNPSIGKRTVWEWRFDCLASHFNEDLARKLAPFPLINSGVFAALVDAPLWEKWARLLGQIFETKHELSFFSDQTALNVAIREEGIPTAMLPARCNWICHRALPMCTESGVVLTEPNPPFESLGVVHLTAYTKNGRFKVLDRIGLPHIRSLRFNGHDDALVGPDVHLALPVD